MTKKRREIQILGIETSCDETGVAIYNPDRGILGHALYSQTSVHSEFGGVVPELASRDHIRRIIPLVREVIEISHSNPRTISAVAYTAGPGLIGSLLVGASVANGLAFGWGVPAIPVNHLEGHLLAPMLEEDSPRYPFIALLVSGGHTQLIRVNQPGDYHMLGESLDDAAGEAFDKTAKILGLGYPGGPALSALAEQGRPGIFEFPRPMIDRPGLDFSFSGLKTAAVLAVRDYGYEEQACADIARGFIDAVVEVLCIKCRRAMEQEKTFRLVVSGGVSANKQLRQAIHHLVLDLDGKAWFPRPEFCTDNGAMIAYAGYFHWQQGRTMMLSADDFRFAALPRWPLIG